MTLASGMQESNTNSVFRLGMVIAVWRPSTGAKIGVVVDFNVTGNSSGSDTSTSEVWVSDAYGGQVGVAALDQDILVFEVWRAVASQGMNTSYNNTVWYDGTTEASATNAASYIDMGQDITLFVAGSAQVPYVNPMPQYLAQ